jgi:hypothetical protein
MDYLESSAKLRYALLRDFWPSSEISFRPHRNEIPCPFLHLFDLS